jgi:hypothetical protein
MGWWPNRLDEPGLARRRAPTRLSRWRSTRLRDRDSSMPFFLVEQGCT